MVVTREILKLFQNYFGDIEFMLENIHELRPASGMILKWFQASFHALK